MKFHIDTGLMAQGKVLWVSGRVAIRVAICLLHLFSKPPATMGVEGAGAADDVRRSYGSGAMFASEYKEVFKTGREEHP